MTVPRTLTQVQRKRIAVVALDSALTVEPLQRQGSSKFAAATALGMRRLKADGLVGSVVDDGHAPASIDGPLSADEEELVESIASTAGKGVGVIADKIEDKTNCKCDREVLALIRALLQVGIEAAVGAIRR